MTYTLSLSATPEQLSRFYEANSYFVLGKSSSGQEPNVLWQVFRPFASNEITWEEKYGIYASTTYVSNRARIRQMSQTEYPAAAGQEYTLLDSAIFSKPEPGGTPGSYSAVNSYSGKEILTFGLFQAATINEENVPGNAISAASVLRESTAKMTPYTAVHIWVQSEVRSNTVVTEITSPRTEVTFGGTTNEISLAYDTATGHFIPRTKGALPEGASLQTYEAPVIL